MSLSQTAPSPFAALLRRSKFASYDPSIGQVYTTHGGHAHRGNWGFKRPLPNRRHTGFITVQSVDSPEQQTEWNSAENSARWIRRWDELGKKLQLQDLGPWQVKMGPTSWKADTEFDRAGKNGLEPGREMIKEDEYLDARSMIQNPDSMTPKQFQKYLKKLRALRPEFKEFLQDTWNKRGAKTGPQLASEKSPIKITGSGEVNMFLSAQYATDAYVSDFLKHRLKRDFHIPESQRVEQRPHILAGLDYTCMSRLQPQYLHPPAPGRDIGRTHASRWEGKNQHAKMDMIAVGGIIGGIPDNRMKHGLVPADFGTRETPRTDKARGKELFRMSRVELADPPKTVGSFPETIAHASLRAVEFRVVTTENKSNPHPLGSAAYVSQEGITTKKGSQPLPQAVVRMTRQVDASVNMRKNTEHGAKLIARLGTMIPKQER